MIEQINKEIRKTIISLICSISVLVFFLINSTDTIMSEETTKNLALLNGDNQNIEFTETSAPISLKDAIPVSDEVGLNTESYTFDVSNFGNSTENLVLLFKENIDSILQDGCKNLPIENLKYYLAIDDKIISEKEVMTQEDLVEFSLKPKETKHFTFKMWITSSAGNEIMGMHLHRNFMVVNKGP